MSTYYLFDMHVPVISAARVVDAVVTTEPGAEFRVDGLTPIRVPDGVHVENPANLAELLQQKYLGLLAQYPGFTNIIHDDLLDGDDVVTAVKSGARGSIGGQILSTAVDISALTASVTQCVLVYEHYTWRYVDSKDGRIARYYVEEPEAAHQARVSLNGGTTFNVTTSGALVALDSGDQGTSAVINLLSDDLLDVISSKRVVMSGSWALIF